MTTSNAPASRARARADEARRLLAETLPGTLYVSFLVPVMHDGRPAVACFVGAMVSSADGANDHAGAPVLEVTLDWETGRELARRSLAPATTEPLSVRPLAFQLPLDEVQRAALDAQVARLDMLLERVMARYAVTPQLHPGDDATRYLEQFEDLVPRPARAYYTAVNPDFFAWVARGR